MKRYLFFVILILGNNLCAQTNDNIIEGDSGCGCEVILIAVPPIVDPADPPILGPGDEIKIEGDLSRFVSYEDGECIRTVEVKERYFESNQIQYRTNNMVNDINALINQYGSFSTFCFDGYFSFTETITISGGRLLRLFDNSVFHYKGNANNPAISFEGVNGGIEGGEIRTSEAMPNGLINISSDGSIINNSFSNVIKNTNLVNQHTEIPRGDGILPNAIDARANRGIVLSNAFETLSSQRDNGSNYFAHIIDVDISGFAVGMHMRGWSNAAHVRNVRFNNIADYGIWISGCVDNSFSDISFQNCKQAFGFRFDNYIDDKINDYSPPDPNLRFPIDIEDELQEVIDGSNDQGEFNTNLELLFRNDATSYFTIFEACERGEKISADPREEEAFLNTVDVVNGADDILHKFGLREYNLDDIANADLNYDSDSRDITTVQNDRTSTDLEISVYKSTFYHPNPPNGVPLLVELQEATCSSDLLYTNFYRAPAFNSFSQVDVFEIEEGEATKQVMNVVQFDGREDGELLCVDRLPPNQNEPCTGGCIYEFLDKNGNINLVNSLGRENSIYLCNLPDDFDINTELINTSNCQNQGRLDIAISLLSY